MRSSVIIVANGIIAMGQAGIGEQESDLQDVMQC